MASFETVPNLPSVPNKVAVGEQSAFHTNYSYIRYYKRQSGLVQLPMCGATGSASSMVRLHAPSERLVIVWDAERVGDIPVLPDPDTGDPNEVFADQVIGSFMPYLMPDGYKQAFRVSGTYLYHLLKPLDKTFPLVQGPFQTTSGRLSIGPKDFKKLA